MAKPSLISIRKINADIAIWIYDKISASLENPLGKQMFTKFGAPELLIILIIVLLLFGPGRIGKIAGELGTGIRSFRHGLSEGEETKPEEQA